MQNYSTYKREILVFSLLDFMFVNNLIKTIPSNKPHGGGLVYSKKKNRISNVALLLIGILLNSFMIS